jgi:integrase
MRRLMGVIQDRHGTYYAQQRVPEPLQAAVARVLGSKKPRQVFLKKSLGTKVLKDANVRAKPVLASFDQILKRASDLVAATNGSKPPKRENLNHTEITRMTEVYFGQTLADDEELRFGGRAIVERNVEWIKNENPEFVLPYPIESVPEFGLTSEQLVENRGQTADALTTARELLAMGDIKAIEDEVNLLLSQFDIDLDRKSPSYRELATNVLRAYVRGLEAIDKRNAGEVIETPKFSLGSPSPASGTLREALEGWKKERARPEDTLSEYTRAVEMFIQLHGNLPVAHIKRPQAREFREALQLVPRTRSGTLQDASLDTLVRWGREHPEAPKVSVGTVNKQLGAVQAVGLWGFRNGLVPDDVPWTDPFQRMRLREQRSTRGPFDAEGLRKIFAAPVFTKQEIPEGGKGAAAVWLPLLALFAGGRQAEFGGLRASNIREDPDTGSSLMWIVADKKVGRSLKNETSERVVPIHSELCKLGFLEFVDSRRREGGERTWLFPAIAPNQRGGLKAWSKWWGKYLRDHIGIEDRDLVFHSFRHGFTDRARAAGVPTEVRKALMGHADNTVSGGYGARNMLVRWGVTVLKEAVEKISYPGLDLSRVRPLETPKSVLGTNARRAQDKRKSI